MVEVFLSHYQYDLQRKMFLLYFIHWPSFIAWLPLPLGNMYIVIACQPVYGVINFEINLSFLTKLFPHMTKMSGQKLNHLETEKGFKDEIKSFFIIFKRTFIEANKTKSNERWEFDLKMLKKYVLNYCRHPSILV